LVIYQISKGPRATVAFADTSGAAAAWGRILFLAAIFGLALFCRGLAFEHSRELRNLLAHDFAGLELHRCSRRNDEAAAGLVRITTDPGLGEFDFKDAEVAQFDSVALCKSIGDVIERPLDDFEDLVLDQACFVTDFNDEFPFR
jgi:hypothetical protein